MKTTSAPKRRPASQRAALLNKIPGWTKVGQVEIPTEAFEKRRDNGRFRESTEPVKIFKTLLVTLWHGVGRIERTSIFSGACTARALTDAMRSWAPTYDDRESILRVTWRGYLGQLTTTQRRKWRDKFDAQLDSWRDWDEASRLAGRVHSVWFRCLDDETPSR